MLRFDPGVGDAPPRCELLWDIASGTAFGDVAFSHDSRLVASVRSESGLIEIRDDVLRVFYANRYTNIFRCHARGHLLLGSELRVRCRGGVDHKGLRVANVREMAGELHVLDETLARFFAAANAKAQDGARSVRQNLLRGLVMRMARKPWVVDPLDEFMCF